MKLRYLIITSTLFLLSGCMFNTEDEKESITKGMSPKELYYSADFELKSGNVDEAVKIYKNVVSAYPASKYAIQSKIQIIYELYKAEKYDLAATEAEDFISKQKNDGSTPYVYYLRGLISEKKGKSILDSVLTDFAQRDITSIINAFNYYLALIKKYPDSKYSAEAKLKLVNIRNAIARHELFVAIFYSKSSAHIAAINRCKYIIETYPNTPSVPAALHLMAFNYEKINETSLAEDTRRVLLKSYPNYVPHYNLND